MLFNILLGMLEPETRLPYNRNMSSLIQRFIEMDTIFRSRKNNSMPELMDHFKLSRRQIFRDIDEMKAVYKAPIAYSRKMGYHYTDELWFLPAMTLSGQDVFALGLATHLLEKYKNTPLYEHLKSVFQRLTQYIDNSEYTLNPSWLSSDVTIASEPPRKLDPKKWETAVHCLQNRQTVQFKYKTPLAKISTRKFQIWHLIQWNGDWYLIGNDLTDDKVKIFALSRIETIKALQEGYTIPESFNIKNHLDPEMGLYINDGPTKRVRVVFDPSAAPYAAERQWHSSQKATKLEDGSLELLFSTNQLTQTCSWLLAWGKSVRVLEPAELVEKMKEHVKGLSTIYF